METAPAFDAVIHPHRSLGTEGFQTIMQMVAGANAIAAIGFWWIGGWPVLVFLGLDVLALYVALRLSFAQTRAFERIVVLGDALTVERMDARGRRCAFRFPSYWVSVRVEENERDRVVLRSHGRSLTVAEFLPPPERKPFAEALREALHAAKDFRRAGPEHPACRTDRGPCPDPKAPP